MRTTRPVAVALATCVCAVAAAPAGASHSCTYMNPATAGLAVQFLRATGTTCATARAVARGIQGSVTARNVLPRRVAADGRRYDCTYRHRAGEPSPSTLVRCDRSTRTVTMRLVRTAMAP
ncbi:MAG: hypothetical protein QOH72_2983 [Solirubrobacteraceae bacterium]|nr:hypothetical protein [Solirubrobacteraceae bacterium]